MHKRFKQIMFAIILGAIIPAIIFGVFAKREEPNDALYHEAENTTVESTIDSGEGQDSISPGSSETTVSVLFENGEVRELSLDTYLVSVILSELPSDFEIEAIKAQAVACRTFTLHKMSQFKHGNAAVCTDSNCCQGYCARETFFSSHHRLPMKNIISGSR